MKNFYFLLLLFLASCGGAASENKSNDTILPIEEYAKAIKTDTTAFIIDVRTPEEYAEGHIDGAVLMNVMDDEAFVVGVDTLSKEHTYYIYCRSGRRSRKATGQMIAKGLTVVDLQGGYNAWKKAEKK